MYTVPVDVVVEWDFDYDGMSFDAAVVGAEPYATTTFATTGQRTVAARLTDAAGAVEVITLGLTVENPPPVVTVPEGALAAVATVPLTLPVTATSSVPITSVEWWFSFEGEDYVFDPTVTTLSPTVTFPTYGGYDVWVGVTDADGHTAEGWFYVYAAEAPPAAAVPATAPTPGGPAATAVLAPDGEDISTLQLNEGATVTFTVRVADPDAVDRVSVYADWYGTGTFDQVPQENWRANPDGTFSFDHAYDQSATGPKRAVIQTENDGGHDLYVFVDLDVLNVAPTVTFAPGQQIAAPAVSNQTVWSITPGQLLELTGANDPSAADRAGLKYHWRVTDEATGQSVIDTESGPPDRPPGPPSVSLPNYANGRIYKVEAWVSDPDGGESPRDPDHPTFVVVAGNVPAFEDRDKGGLGTFSNGIYGGLADGPEGTPLPAGYNRYGYRSRLDHGTWPGTEPLPMTFVLDPSSLELGRQPGNQIVYHMSVSVTDVSPTFWGGFNNTPTDEGGPVQTNTSGVFAIPALPNDREVSAFGWAEVMRDGQRLVSTIYSEVTTATPKTKSIVQQAQDALAMVKTLVQRLGDNAQVLVNALTDNPGRVFSTLVDGLSGAIEEFGRQITDPAKLRGKLFAWLFGPNAQTLGNLDLAALDLTTEPGRAALQSAVLQYAGLTWDHVYQVVQDQLGAGNLAAVEEVVGWFNGVEPGRATDLTALLGRIEGVDLAAVQAQVEQAVQDKLKEALGRAALQFAAKFVPGASLVTSLYQGFTWVLDNLPQFEQLFSAFVASVGDVAAGNSAGVKSKFLTAFEAGVPLALNFAASQLGLRGLPQQVQQALAFVPQRVDKALRDAVAAAARRGAGALAGGTTGAGMFTGKMAREATFELRGTNYVLWVSQPDDPRRGGPVVKVVPRTGTGYGQVIALTPAMFTDPGARGRLAAVVSAATALQQAARKRVPPQRPDADTMQAIGRAQAALAVAEAALKVDLERDACTALGAGCFAAGTKLLTRTGFRAVEDIRHGDEVLARSEHDPAGEAEWKAVEDTFRRTGRVLHLHAGGEVIRTTPEHPFYVRDGGWKAAGALQPGDRIATLSGEWVAVEEGFDTGLYEDVYNLRVADHHTYFVGDDAWGFALWAHNAYSVQHTRPGTNGGPTQFQEGEWSVYRDATVRATTDRYVRTADGSAPYAYRTLDEARQAAINQNAAVEKALHGTTDGDRFEQRVRRRYGSNVTLVAEHIIRLDGTAAGEIDFQTSSNLVECGTSFRDKTDQLILLCVVARLRGKTVIGVHREDNPDRIATYTAMMQNTTFWDPRVQSILRQLVPNPEAYSDDTPLSAYFARFELLS